MADNVQYVSKEAEESICWKLRTLMNLFFNLEFSENRQKWPLIPKKRLLFVGKKKKSWSQWDTVGCVHVNTFFYLSDMRNAHGAWNVLTASSLTRREWCHHPWGPVNAAAQRAWRHVHGELRTVVTLTPIGRDYSTGTRSTRWETLLTATGGKRARVADMETLFHEHFETFLLSATSPSATRDQSRWWNTLK